MVNKKLNWLDEVREDAKFNYLRRKREQDEKVEHEKAKLEKAQAKEEAQKEAAKPVEKEVEAKPVSKKGK